MQPQQRESWFVIILCGSSLVVFFILLQFMTFERALGAFALLGFSGISPFLFYRGRKKGKVVSDERDIQIGQRAGMIAFAVMWVVFVLALVALLQIRGDQGSVPVPWCTALLFAAFFIMLAARALAILILYHRGAAA